jgi:hypothetical protein
MKQSAKGREQFYYYNLDTRGKPGWWVGGTCTPPPPKPSQAHPLATPQIIYTYIKPVLANEREARFMRRLSVAPRLENLLGPEICIYCIAIAIPFCGLPFLPDGQSAFITNHPISSPFIIIFVFFPSHTIQTSQQHKSNKHKHIL